MKLTLQHHRLRPSASFTNLVNTDLESLQKLLRIDEARILVEHRFDESPGFRVVAHLVTPGPDVLAEAVDHTLRAAWQKVVLLLQSRIAHRTDKREQRKRGHFRTNVPSQPVAAGVR